MRKERRFAAALAFSVVMHSLFGVMTFISGSLLSEMTSFVELTETFPGAFDAARTGEMRCSVKVRSRAAAAPCTVRMIGEGRVSVVFDAPERAPAAGQTAAFYDGDVVLGGGFID